MAKAEATHLHCVLESRIWNLEKRMAQRTNELLFLMLLIVWGSYVSASRKLLTDSPKVEEEGSSSPKTITFFMHHITGGPNPTANRGLGVAGFPIDTGNAISGLPNQFGNSINFNGNGNGPLPLTIRSGAINNSPFFGQLPISSTNGGVQGIGSLIPGLGLNAPTLGLQNSFPNTNIINGGLNPLGGSSGIPLNNVVVIEDTLTEGPDLHSSAILGKGEGYYYHLPSHAEEEDPNTILLAFTAKFEGSEYGGSSIEFSGKDNIALAQREVAVVGGSGVFHDAQGHALIQTVSHTVDETLLKFTATLTYE
ncbi:dirigent protein 10-like [Cryptomeria japonica]|uniref:dirigent protein 10-like n=1 Tax=Cryptomeria japonica TaxID=3369 RepID=UPI0027DA0883|nr:dirigent protein 10-like [Cryptomeria japonica]